MQFSCVCRLILVLKDVCDLIMMFIHAMLMIISCITISHIMIINNTSDIIIMVTATITIAPL